MRFDLQHVVHRRVRHPVGDRRAELHTVHDELARVIQSYSENELAGAFVVVEPYGHRFRKPSL
jgi:hypothetical protein